MTGLEPRPRPVVLFDALGTLVRLEPPAPRLQRSLAARLGLELSLDRCEAAMRAELHHYGAHCVRARDAASLAALRLECSDVLADALAAGPHGPELLPCLTDALHFEPYDDARPALAALAGEGRMLAVVSNWDVSLPPLLERLGLAGDLRAVVHAAGVGVSKPDPRPFTVALELLGVAPEEAVHVGDDPVTDGEGARAAGIEPILVDRKGRHPRVRMRTVGTLTEVAAALAELERGDG